MRGRETTINFGISEIFCSFPVYFNWLNAITALYSICTNIFQLNIFAINYAKPLRRNEMPRLIRWNGGSSCKWFNPLNYPKQRLFEMPRMKPSSLVFSFCLTNVDCLARALSINNSRRSRLIRPS